MPLPRKEGRDEGDCPTRVQQLRLRFDVVQSFPRVGGRGCGDDATTPSREERHAISNADSIENVSVTRG